MKRNTSYENVKCRISFLSYQIFRKYEMPKKKVNLRIILFSMTFVLVYVISIPASAFYQPEYQNRGNTNVLDGVCPKPGFLFQAFFFNFKSVRLKDNHSHTLPGDFKLSVNTSLYNFVYITPQKLFGGFLGIELMIPLINGHLTTDSPSGVRRDHDHGLSDVFLGGFIQWKKTESRFPIYYRLLGGMFFPTGSYSHKKLFNVGYNLYTFHFNQATTIFLTPRLTVSWRIMYNVHTENHEYGPGRDDLRPGQLFSVTFSPCYEIRKGIQLALIGNYWKQTTDDELNGHDFKVGKEQVLGLGPGIILNRKNIFFIIHGLFDSQVKSRPEGSLFQGRLMWFF